MIKSITFTGETGYITKTIPEPELGVRGYDPETRTMNWDNTPTEEQQKRIDKYHEEYDEWLKHKDEWEYPQLIKNLLNRKIEFEQGKINLIFGPNASGKTTILKALAGNAGTTDGYCMLADPLDIRFKFGEPITDGDFRLFLNKKMQNAAVIEWDGAPVYYDNFVNRRNYGEIGNLSGSVLGDSIIGEIEYMMVKDKVSLGQNSIFLMDKLFDIAKRHLCYAEIFSDFVEPDGTRKEMHCNESWKNAYNVQLDYYLGMEKSFVKGPGTFLFDELDKSLDVTNIYTLYDVVLPALVEQTGVQIIIISHSPLVLSDRFMNSDKYNFISMDEKYTKECKECVDKMFHV